MCDTKVGLSRLSSFLRWDFVVVARVLSFVLCLCVVDSSGLTFSLRGPSDLGDLLPCEYIFPTLMSAFCFESLQLMEIFTGSLFALATNLPAHHYLPILTIVALISSLFPR